MDRDILSVYGDYVWRFIPEKWRYWWIESVVECDTLESVTIEMPEPIFTDITKKIDNMKYLLEKNTLADIMKCCNTYLIPSVLCPCSHTKTT